MFESFDHFALLTFFVAKIQKYENFQSIKGVTAEVSEEVRIIDSDMRVSYAGIIPSIGEVSRPKNGNRTPFLNKSVKI